HRRQREALLALGRVSETVPGHLVQHFEITRVALDDLGVVRNGAFEHADQRAEVLALQLHRSLALPDQHVGLDLSDGGERAARAERQGDTGPKDLVVHSVPPLVEVATPTSYSGVRRIECYNSRRRRSIPTHR